MKNIKAILFTLAFVSAIAGAFANMALDVPVRAVVDGFCQVINICTTVNRGGAGFCPIAPDDGNFYNVSDINCSTPLTSLIYRRINQ